MFLQLAEFVGQVITYSNTQLEYFRIFEQAMFKYLKTRTDISDGQISGKIEFIIKISNIRTPLQTR